MTRRRPLFMAVLAAVLAAVAFGRCEREPPKSGGGPTVPTEASPQPVALEWDGPPECVLTALRYKLATGAEFRTAFGSMVTVDRHDPLFPEDTQLSLNAHRTVSNPALAAYSSLSSDDRSRDLMLLDVSGDVYWATTMTDGSKADQFKCEFILHISAATGGGGKARTRIEVVEYLPRVDLGKTIGIGQHGPGPKRDVRDVAPTDADRVSLVGMMKAVLSRECPSTP